MRRVVFGVLCCLVWGTALAQEITTAAEAFEAGKDFAGNAKNTAGGMVNQRTGQSQLPFYTDKAPESGLYQRGRHSLANVGSQKKEGCVGHRADTPFLQQECDAANFISRSASERPRFELDPKKDPLLSGSRKIINQPGSVPGAESQQCRVEQVSVPASHISETCMESRSLSRLSCQRVLRVTCDPVQDGCDQGGIIPGSWAGDMATSFTPDNQGNYILQFGTIADDYWRGWGAVYDRNLVFQIRDVDQIQRFSLTRAAFDDWLLVRINGHQVYVGPKGGDRLEIFSAPAVIEPGSSRECFQQGPQSWQCQDKTRFGDLGGDRRPLNQTTYAQCSAQPGGGWSCQAKDPRTGLVQYCETCFSGPELSTSWDFNLDINLIPYLKDGENTIFMRTIVARGGEGAIQITTRQLCPRNCRDEWDESLCEPLKQRAAP